MLKIALLVGVSEYQPGLQPLPSAIEDVRAMERVLQHPEMGGFDKVDVLSNPSTQELRIAIYNLFAERSPEDLVLFYFSGHGVKDQNLNLYLTTPETTKSQRGLVVPPTAVAASYLQTQINDSRSEHEVIILDCCYSGAIAKGLTAKDEGAVDIIAELGGKGRAILTSSSSVQSSFQQEGGLSIYTQYLVEGIETGAADLDNDGRISADELHQYANKNVQQASPAMTPQFYPVEEGYRIYLARSPIDDPKLKYRKEAQKRAEKGKFTLIGRRILTHLQIELGLSREEAETIEGEVLQPYREYRQKLQDFQKLLQLKDEDVEPIEAQLTPNIEPPRETEPEVTKPAADSKPTTKTKSQLTPPQTDTKQLQVFEFDVVTVKLEVQRSGLFGLGSKVLVNSNRSKSQASYFTEDLGNGITLDLVAIPGGKFLMGSPPDEKNSYSYERPQHEVTVQPFFMGKYPVTQAQWQAVMGNNPAHFQDSPQNPVEQVSWHDAVEFCQRLSQKTGRKYRLPSEAEWEYACRSVISHQSSVISEELTVEEWNEQYHQPFHFGETITGELANYDASETYAGEAAGKYRRKTTPVGSFPPNGFGLYDMHGNVWEWCGDTWHDNYEGAPTDGSAWTGSGDDNRSPLRGGSWNNNPFVCRSAYRNYVIWRRDNIYGLVGFRVVSESGRTP